MLGKKLYKNNAEDMAQYTECAKWCNENNCHIEDKGEYYEVVENEVIPPAPAEATWQDRIEAQVMYTALLTDSLLGEGEE